MKLADIFKFCARSNLNYTDSTYERLFNEYSKKIETVRYKTAFMIIASIKGTSGDTLYQDLGL